MSRAALFGLQHEIHACAGNRFAHTLRLMSDDHEDVFRGHDLLRRGNHMRQNRLATDFMQNFRMLRFEPRAFSGGHDCDGDVVAAVGFDAEAFDVVFVAVCGAFAMLSQYTAPESTP